MVTESLRISGRQPTEVLIAAKEVAKGLGWTINESPNQLKMQTPSSLRSWGETITVEVGRDPQVTTSVNVTVRSSSDKQLFDWGKSKQNVNVLLKGLREKLS